MYVPEAFDEARRDVLAALVRAHPLGLLISAGPAGLVANPVPFVCDPEAGPHGTLGAHFARANGQWRELRRRPLRLGRSRRRPELASFMKV